MVLMNIATPKKMKQCFRDGAYIYIYIWVNYKDLTATSLESWLIRGSQTTTESLPGGPHQEADAAAPFHSKLGSVN